MEQQYQIITKGKIKDQGKPLEKVAQKLKHEKKRVIKQVGN